MTGNKMTLLTMLIVVGMCARAPRAAQPSSEQGRAALSGTWVLNRELSQAPPSLAKAARRDEGVGATEGFRAGALHLTAAAGVALAGAADSGAALREISEEAVQIRNR